jgi:hypothetical protein
LAGSALTDRAPGIAACAAARFLGPKLDLGGARAQSVLDIHQPVPLAGELAIGDDHEAQALVKHRSLRRPILP